MGAYEEQIKANAAAIQAILDNSKDYEQLDAYVDSPGDGLIITIRNIVTNKTYKITEQQFATLILNYVPVSTWRWIEGSDVKKDVGNVDLETLEVGDTVKFKQITNGGFAVTIPFGVYAGGDKQLVGSYTIPILVT